MKKRVDELEERLDFYYGLLKHNKRLKKDILLDIIKELNVELRKEKIKKLKQILPTGKIQT